MIPHTLAGWFSLALWLAAIGHFVLLAATIQVPSRLKWKDELARLRPLNRKLLWTYGGFTVLTNVAFGVLTFALHDELLRGDRAALGLAFFIGVYWATRIGVEMFYFRPSDWPEGRGVAVGRALLTFLFVALTSTYLGLVIWHGVT